MTLFYLALGGFLFLLTWGFEALCHMLKED